MRCRIKIFFHSLISLLFSYSIIVTLFRSVVTPYVLAPNCFVFKSHRDGQEYKCNTKELSKLSRRTDVHSTNNLAAMGNFVMDNLLDTSLHGNLMKDVAGISPVADQLALGSPPPKLPRPPLVDPTLVTRKKKGKKLGKKR